MFHFRVNYVIIDVKGAFMDTNKYAAEQLRRLREFNNLTQAELAEKLNIKQQQIARYENNRRVFKHSFLCDLSDCFNVPIDYFFPTSSSDDIPYTMPKSKGGSVDSKNFKKYSDALNKLGLIKEDGEIDEIRLKTLTQMIEFQKKLNSI